MNLSELGQSPIAKAAYSQAALKKFQEGIEADSKAEFPWAGVGIFAGGFILYAMFSGKKKAV